MFISDFKSEINGFDKTSNGFSSVGRALVSKTRCREFESLNPCTNKMMSIINFIKESVTELRDNVKWTPRSELLNLSALVIVFSVIFSLAIWGADSILSRIVKLYFNLIG